MTETAILIMEHVLNRRLLPILVVLAIMGAGAWQYQRQRSSEHASEGLASGNGRIEAVEIDIAARTAGRVSKVLVKEGDFVSEGQILATLEIDQLSAEKLEGDARLARAQVGVDTAKSMVSQRLAEREAAAAAVAQNDVLLQSARRRLARSIQLSSSGSVSEQTLDDDRARADGAAATLAVAKANMSASEAAVSAAQAQVVDAKAAVEAARATIARIEADLRDGELKAPRKGRIQYLVAQPGEVVAAGGRVLNMLDVTDVYMTFFLPTAAAGRVAIGSDARIVLDAAPQYVVPARISFISDVAQFTPKTVETDEEREKLMFRVKAQVPAELLLEHIAQVKTGLPGRAYVLAAPDAHWPPHLERAVTP